MNLLVEAQKIKTLSISLHTPRNHTPPLFEGITSEQISLSHVRRPVKNVIQSKGNRFKSHGIEEFVTERAKASDQENKGENKTHINHKETLLDSQGHLPLDKAIVSQTSNDNNTRPVEDIISDTATQGTSNNIRINAKMSKESDNFTRKNTGDKGLNKVTNPDTPSFPLQDITSQQECEPETKAQIINHKKTLLDSHLDLLLDKPQQTQDKKSDSSSLPYWLAGGLSIATLVALSLYFFKLFSQTKSQRERELKKGLISPPEILPLTQ